MKPATLAILQLVGLCTAKSHSFQSMIVNGNLKGSKHPARAVRSANHRPSEYLNNEKVLIVEGKTEPAFRTDQEAKSGKNQDDDEIVSVPETGATVLCAIFSSRHYTPSFCEKFKRKEQQKDSKGAKICEFYKLSGYTPFFCSDQYWKANREKQARSSSLENSGSIEADEIAMDTVLESFLRGGRKSSLIPRETAKKFVYRNQWGSYLPYGTTGPFFKMAYHPGALLYTSKLKKQNNELKATKNKNEKSDILKSNKDGYEISSRSLDNKNKVGKIVPIINTPVVYPNTYVPYLRGRQAVVARKGNFSNSQLLVSALALGTGLVVGAAAAPHIGSFISETTQIGNSYRPYHRPTGSYPNSYYQNTYPQQNYYQTSSQPNHYPTYNPTYYPSSTTVSSPNYSPTSTIVSSPNYYPTSTTINTPNHYPSSTTVNTPNHYPTSTTVNTPNYYPTSTTVSRPNYYQSSLNPYTNYHNSYSDSYTSFRGIDVTDSLQKGRSKVLMLYPMVEAPLHLQGRQGVGLKRGNFSASNQLLANTLLLGGGVVLGAAVAPHVSSFLSNTLNNQNTVRPYRPLGSHYSYPGNGYNPYQGYSGYQGTYPQSHTQSSSTYSYPQASYSYYPQSTLSSYQTPTYNGYQNQYSFPQYDTYTTYKRAGFQTPPFTKTEPAKTVNKEEDKVVDHSVMLKEIEHEHDEQTAGQNEGMSDFSLTFGKSDDAQNGQSTSDQSNLDSSTTDVKSKEEDKQPEPIMHIPDPSYTRLRETEEKEEDKKDPELSSSLRRCAIDQAFLYQNNIYFTCRSKGETLDSDILVSGTEADGITDGTSSADQQLIPVLLEKAFPSKEGAGSEARAFTPEFRNFQLKSITRSPLERKVVTGEAGCLPVYHYFLDSQEYFVCKGTNSHVQKLNPVKVDYGWNIAYQSNAHGHRVTANGEEQPEYVPPLPDQIVASSASE